MIYSVFTLALLTTVNSGCKWGYNITFNNADNQVLAERHCTAKNISSTFDFKLSSVIIDGNQQPINGEWNDQDIGAINESGFLDNVFTSTHNDYTIEWEYEFKDTDGPNSHGNVKFSINTLNVLYEDKLEICFEMNAETNNYNHFGLNATELNVNISDDVFYEEITNDTDYHIVAIGEYLLENELEAECHSTQGVHNMSVFAYSTKSPPLDGSHLDESGMINVGCSVCYQFERCEGGNIVYDPVVYYEGEEPSSGIKLVVMYSFAVWMSLYLYFM